MLALSRSLHDRVQKAVRWFGLRRARGLIHFTLMSDPGRSLLLFSVSASDVDESRLNVVGTYSAITWKVLSLMIVSFPKFSLKALLLLWHEIQALVSILSTSKITPP